MVNKHSYILVLFVLLMSAGVQAEVDSLNIRLPKDTVARLYHKSIVKTTVVQVTDSMKAKAFKSDPTKVVWMAAILPGYGQILNKKYWKLPIVYGGFLGCAYAITWNNGRYQSYKNAYLDILRYNSDASYQKTVQANPGAISFYQILPKGVTIDNLGGFAQYTVYLQQAQDGSRRYRDLSVIISIAYYALTIVDAYVDAQLYDFDISPDLSMHLEPALIQNKNGLNKTLGLQCSIRLK